MNARENYLKWIQYSELEPSLLQELLALEDNETEILERFATKMEFGTGGIRGIIRAGTNGMNIYTVRQATQGLANLIVKIGQVAMD